MLEVVFSAAAKGSMRVGLGTSGENIFCFPLELGVGNIDEDGFWAGREEVLSSLGVYDPAGRIAAARRELGRLLSAALSEDVRVWTGPAPAETCGACWIVEQLGVLSPPPRIIMSTMRDYIVSSADSPVRSFGEAVHCRGWDEVPPREWAELSSFTHPIAPGLTAALALQWARIRRENSPLRAVVNGALLSVGAEFYDSIILSELGGMDREFTEAELTERVSARLPGVGAGLIRLRIGSFVARGILTRTAVKGKEPVLCRK